MLSIDNPANKIFFLENQEGPSSLTLMGLVCPVSMVCSVSEQPQMVWDWTSNSFQWTSDISALVDWDLSWLPASIEVDTTSTVQAWILTLSIETFQHWWIEPHWLPASVEVGITSIVQIQTFTPMQRTDPHWQCYWHCLHHWDFSSWHCFQLPHHPESNEVIGQGINLEYNKPIVILFQMFEGKEGGLLLVCTGVQ